MGEDERPLFQEVSADRSQLLTRIYTENMSSRALIDFDQRVEIWVNRNLREYALTGGGAMLMFAHLGDQNIKAMLGAFSVALIASMVILGVAYRSTQIAIATLFCNLLPVLFVYSIWAWVDGLISIGAAVVMGMILGILLDDSVYLINASCRKKKNSAAPVSAGLARVGPALVITTTTLVAGLSFGLLSDFGPVWSMSALAVSAIAVALVVDLLLLPAFLYSIQFSEASR